MSNSVTFADLESGAVARIRPAQLARLAGQGLSTIHRKIKEGKIAAVATDGRLYVPGRVAVEYIRGSRHAHDPQNVAAIARMETARNAKGVCK